MPLTDLPPDARPREKLLARGPQALADAELLALLLRTGLKGLPVLQLAQSLLDQFGGWHGLLHAGTGEIADRLGAVLIAVFGDHRIQLFHQVVIERDRNALHGSPQGV